MGFPALVIPESLLDDLENVIASETISVQRRDLTITNPPVSANFLDFELVCTGLRNDIVILRFGHDRSFPGKAIIALYLESSSRRWKFWRQNVLMKQIEMILRSRGATDGATELRKNRKCGSTA